MRLPAAAGNRQAALTGEGEKPHGLERHGLTTSIGTGDHQGPALGI